MDTITTPHLGVIRWFLEKVTLFWVKHVAFFGVNIENFVPLFKLEAFEILLESFSTTMSVTCQKIRDGIKHCNRVQALTRQNSTKVVMLIAL